MYKGMLFQKIMQTWWHFEDNYSKDPFQKRRYVQDIYLDKSQVESPDFENTLKVSLPKNIFEIHVRMRNPSNELAYVVVDESNSEMVRGDGVIMYVHLQNLGDLPVVEIMEDQYVRQYLHLKLEIEYSQKKDVSITRGCRNMGAVAHSDLLILMMKKLRRNDYLHMF